jgi:polar amino acid transport system substrate-binding protein
MIFNAELINPLLQAAKKRKKTNLILTCFLICFVCIFNACTQPNLIRLGIRTAAYPIGFTYPENASEYGGFCSAFKEELEKQFSVKVEIRGIANEYKGDNYPRFDGLIKNSIDIECGPNSKTSLSLLAPSSDPNLKKPYGQIVAVTEQTFYETGVRLLLENKTTQRLRLYENSSELELKNKLKSLKIGVVPGTTTFQQLDRFGYNPYPIPTPVDPTTGKPDQKRSLRVAALQSLEKGEIDAFASDALILQTILEEKIPGENISSPDYVVFPSKAKEYLYPLEKEEYRIVIQKGLVDTWQTKVDSVLQKLINEGWQKTLENYEARYGFSAPKSPPPIIPRILLILGLIGSVALVAAIILGYVWRRWSNNQGNFTGMSDDLSQAVPQIQKLIRHRQSWRVSADIAEHRVVQTLIMQSQESSRVRQKLEHWSESLDDPSVSEPVKRVISRAFFEVPRP